MISYRIFICLLIGGSIFSWNKGFSQHKVEQGNEFWPQYYLSYSLDSNWSLSSDYSHRYSNFEEKTQWIGRVGLNYQLSRLLSVSAGYAYSEYFSANAVRRENRPWQQVQLLNKLKWFSLQHRLRLEERFNKDSKGNRFNYRLRFQVQMHVPILPAQKLMLFLSEEPMLNFGQQVQGNKFDQNRIQAGFQIKIARNLFFTPAYQHTYQIQSNKKDFKSLDILRTGFTYKR